jgi:hypothetical protein
MELTFEWDEGKAQENFTKHKIRFEEGKTVFNDPFLTRTSRNQTGHPRIHANLRESFFPFAQIREDSRTRNLCFLYNDFIG